jgi:hypothetical protein
MTNQTFSRISVSTREDLGTRVRFTSNNNREIILIKEGHDDMTFLELPKLMTKPEASAWLFERKADFERLNDRIAIDDANDRYNPAATVVVKKSKATVAKPKATPTLANLKGRAIQAKQDKQAQEAQEA